MISALYRYPRGSRRQAAAREWGRRSGIARRALRLAAGPDADTLRRRALADRRGRLVCAIYARGSELILRHSVAGRIDQFDILIDGSLWRTCGPRRLPAWLRPLRTFAAFAPLRLASAAG